MKALKSLGRHISGHLFDLRLSEVLSFKTINEYSSNELDRAFLNFLEEIGYPDYEYSSFLFEIQDFDQDLKLAVYDIFGDNVVLKFRVSLTFLGSIIEDKILELSGLERSDMSPDQCRKAKQIDYVESVPKSSEFLLRLFVPKSIRCAIIGDLEEEFRTEILPNYGYKKARFWYHYQVFNTIWPYARRAIIRLITFGWLAKSADGLLKKFLG